MKFADNANALFDKIIELYHVTDDVDAQVPSPYAKGTIEYQIFAKC